jgi:hypothetical protein
VVPIVDLLLPVKYSPNGKYDNRYFLMCIIDLTLNGVSWRRYKGSPSHPIDGCYLNEIHNNYKRNGVYEAINKQILNRYLKKGKEDKLRYQIIDSTFEKIIAKAMIFEKANFNKLCLLKLLLFPIKVDQ